MEESINHWYTIWIDKGSHYALACYFAKCLPIL